MVRENIWGYKCIQGELKKLDIILSKSTVANILRRNNWPPSPERKGLIWKEFLAPMQKHFFVQIYLPRKSGLLVA